MRKIAKNINETQKIAELFFAKILQNRDKHSGAIVVGLSGNLGVGKTAFIKAVGKYLGIKHKINSPTFVITKKYPLKLKGYTFLFHVDAYRLENEKELLHLGWEEIISKKEHLVFIEWPEKVSKVMPARSRFVYISTDKNGLRKLELK